jgi:hypothetical protein
MASAIDYHHCPQCSESGRRFNARLRRRLQPLCAKGGCEQMQ